MRILVVSDVHGAVHRLRRILESHPEARTVFFLGDGERDMDSVMDEFPGKSFVCVRGNCDIGSTLPSTELRELMGKRIFATHGHEQYVKHGDTALLEQGRALGADLVLYGHTHTPESRYEEGLYVMNPGSVREGRYGFADITDSGIMCVCVG